MSVSKTKSSSSGDGPGLQEFALDYELIRGKNKKIGCSEKRIKSLFFSLSLA